MAIQTLYDAASPYYNSEVTDNYLDVMVNRPIPKYEGDFLFTITNTYDLRPDLLAYDLYNNSNLWWVFAQRNPNILMDPLFDFRAGVKIFLPSRATLETALGV